MKLLITRGQHRDWPTPNQPLALQQHTHIQAYRRVPIQHIQAYTLDSVHVLHMI